MVCHEMTTLLPTGWKTDSIAHVSICGLVRAQLGWPSPASGRHRGALGSSEWWLLFLTLPCSRDGQTSSRPPQWGLYLHHNIHNAHQPRLAGQ